MSIEDLAEATLLVDRVIHTYPREVLKASPSDTLVLLSRQFERKQAGVAMVCHNGDQLAGVVSLGDIVRTVAELGSGALYLPVRMIMTCDVVTCELHEPITNALEKMSKHNVLHLPVVDGGKLVGCIEKTDALQTLYNEAQLDFEQLRNYVFKTGGRY